MPCIVNKRHLMLVLSLAMQAHISFRMHEAVFDSSVLAVPEGNG